MVLDEIVALRGIAGYVVPSPACPWLLLRLQDGTWLRVQPADAQLEYYLIEPADALSRDAGIRPEFLAVWGAYGYISRLGLAALERAATIAKLVPEHHTPVSSPIEGLEIVEVAHEDDTMPAVKLLRELAAHHGGAPGLGAVSFAGNVRPPPQR